MLGKAFCRAFQVQPHFCLRSLQYFYVFLKSVFKSSIDFAISFSLYAVFSRSSLSYFLPPSFSSLGRLFLPFKNSLSSLKFLVVLLNLSPGIHPDHSPWRPFLQESLVRGRDMASWPFLLFLILLCDLDMWFSSWCLIWESCLCQDGPVWELHI